MNISWIAGIGAFLAMAGKIYAAIQVFIKQAQPIIDSAEDKAKDGVIDKADRKALVTEAIALLQTKGHLKIPWFIKPFMGIIINAVAKKLPDFEIKRLAQAVTDEAAGNIKKVA